MRFLVLALFVAAAASAPLEPLDGGNPVELIVNGVSEGEPLEINDIVDIRLKEHVDGEVVAASNLLHPFSAVGLAEAAAAVEAGSPVPETPAVAPEEIPSPVVIPEPALPEVDVPEPIVLPAPAEPEVIDTVEVNPSPIVLPEPAVPEVETAPVAQFPNGEVFNDGTVSVTINGPQEPSIIASLQSWFSMVLNYFQNGVQTTQQIV